MRRSLRAILGLVSGCVMAYAQHIVFTMRTHPSCPVVITSVWPSKEFGFEQVTLLDDSGKPIDSMELRVVPHGPGQAAEEDHGQDDCGELPL